MLAAACLILERERKRTTGKERKRREEEKRREKGEQKREGERQRRDWVIRIRSGHRLEAHMCAHRHTDTRTRTHTHTHTHMHTCMHIYTHRGHACMYTCTHKQHTQQQLVNFLPLSIASLLVSRLMMAISPVPRGVCECGSIIISSSIISIMDYWGETHLL